ncbi:carboxypeptidase regulatory-like domain-containing protein [Burkholderia sp. JP2-270]|nr:carboxypeptidase regulatory-like domain-containing protein [Burkholderia sp. JP2-270]
MLIRFPCMLLACVLSSAAPNVAFAQSVPAAIRQNGIAYVTGGVGADEIAAFRAVAPRYNLRITLASKAGEYLSDVDITISSGKVSILDAHTAGPFLFARVPPGRYAISAHDRGVQEVRHVVVPARGAVDVRFYWRDPDRSGAMRLCASCPGPRPGAAR